MGPIEPRGPGCPGGPGIPGKPGLPFGPGEPAIKEHLISPQPARRARALADSQESPGAPFSHFSSLSDLCFLTSPLRCPIGSLNLTRPETDLPILLKNVY